jgi:hypothetical protein
MSVLPSDGFSSNNSPTTNEKPLTISSVTIDDKVITGYRKCHACHGVALIALIGSNNNIAIIIIITNSVIITACVIAKC